VKKDKRTGELVCYSAAEAGSFRHFEAIWVVESLDLEKRNVVIEECSKAGIIGHCIVYGILEFQDILYPLGLKEFLITRVKLKSCPKWLLPLRRLWVIYALTPELHTFVPIRALLNRLLLTSAIQQVGVAGIGWCYNRRCWCYNSVESSLLDPG
jgi:hypothetical protein